MELISPLDLFFRLIVSVVLTGIIGYERESIRTPAGLRTNILVGLGACLVMLISLQLAESLNNPNIDPGRIAGQVIVGVGFLGAGAIIQSRGAVHGLTSAATIWVVAAIGLAVGAGYYFPGILVTVIVFLTLHILRRFESHVNQESKQKNSKTL